MRTQHRPLVGLTLAALAALALAGCAGTSNPSSTKHAAHTVVTIYSPDPGTEGQEFEASWKEWAGKNGITINYTGDKNFSSTIATKIQSNALPDIAFFPQPGLLSAAIATGKVVELDSATADAVKQNFSPDWRSYATSNGKLYAVPLDASVKGYVWYSPSDFRKWGVSVPKTYAELVATTQIIQAKTGKAPWCAGFNSGTASGWPGADQLAEVVLGDAGPATYDAWVKGTTKFTDPKIDDAFTLLGKILKNPKYVNAGFGDVQSINSTAFGDVAAQLANGSCALTNQATFLEASLFNAKTKSGATPTVGPNGDIWAFPLPSHSAGNNAVVGGGDFAAAFNTNPATKKVMQYLASADWANNLVSAPKASFLSANKGVRASNVKDPLLKSAIQTLQDPKTTFRFGADDAMPNVVENAFWKGIVDWINGTPQRQVEQEIQAAWASAR